jgi:hypothetical protein
VFLVLTVIGAIGLLAKEWKQRHTLPTGILVLLAYLTTGIFGTAVYEHTLFIHYALYLFPVVFLLAGWLSFEGIKRWYAAPVVIVMTGLFIWHNSQNMPLQTAGWTLDDIARTADSIAQRTEPDQPYNIVLLSGTGDIDAQNYRYFLTTTDNPPVRDDQRGEVEQLFIINEDRKLDRVVDSPVYEIVVFPNKEPVEVYTVPEGPEITVLSTNTTEE